MAASCPRARGRVHVHPGLAAAGAAALTRLRLGGAGASSGRGGPARDRPALGPRPLQVGQGARGGVEAAG